MDINFPETPGLILRGKIQVTDFDKNDIKHVEMDTKAKAKQRTSNLSSLSNATINRVSQSISTHMETEADPFPQLETIKTKFKPY